MTLERFVRLLIGRPVGSLSRLVTIGALPPTLATRLDLRLTDREQRRLRRFTALVAGLRRLLPRPLRPGRDERAFEGAA